MSSRSSRRAPVIIGVGLSDLPIAEHLDGVQHHALAAQRAIRDAGIEKQSIDGYASAGGSGGEGIDDAVTMAEYLRVDHRFLDGTMTGGSSFEFHVQHAAQAIREGSCDTMLITYGSDQFSRRGRKVGGRDIVLATGSWPPSIRGAFRSDDRRRLRHGSSSTHARVRHHVRGSGGDRRGHSPLCNAESARNLP